jgi:hypothetical protein
MNTHFQRCDASVPLIQREQAIRCAAHHQPMVSA